MRPWHKLASLALTGFVIVPLAIGPGFLPWQVRELWSFAALFPDKPEYWLSHHVQLLGADGEWYEVGQGPPFEHETFGTMTRLDLLLMNLTFLDLTRASPAQREEVNRQGGAILEGIAAAITEAYASSGADHVPRPLRGHRIVQRLNHPVSHPPVKMWSRRLEGPVSGPDFRIVYELHLDADGNGTLRRAEEARS